MSSPASPAADSPEQCGSTVLDVELPVRYFVADGMWGYAVDSPAILGGCFPTRAAAEQAALEALARSLRSSGVGDTRGRRDPDDSEPGIIRVRLSAHEPPPDAQDRAVPTTTLPVDDRRRVADVMSRAVIGVGAATSRDEIVATLRRFGVSAVPVIDEAYRPLGVVSEADLVAHWTEDATPSGAHRVADRRANAADLMTAPAVTVSASASLAEAARLMTERRIRRLIAVYDDGRVAGVVSRHDLLLGA